MSDILFVTLDAGGNVAPALAIGAELRDRGHRVRVLSHDAQRIAVKSAGLEFIAYQNSPEWVSAETRSTLDGFRRLVRVFTDPAVARDVLDVVADDPADLVVVDCMLLNAIDAVAKTGQTQAVLFHTFYEYFDGPWRRGPIGLVGWARRLGPRRLWRSADLSIVTSDGMLDPAAARTNFSKTVWTGAIIDPADPAPPRTPPRFLASLSTNAFPGQRKVLQRILDAVDGMPIELVMTTGPSIDPTELHAPPNATLHTYVSHDELMPTCSAVIGHGGHATTFRALGYGLPLVLIPMHPALDQPMLARAIRDAGAGIALSRRSSPDRIQDALMRILDDDCYRKSAAKIGKRLRCNDGARTAADRLLELI